MGSSKPPKSIAPVVTKTNLYEKKSDAAYWRALPPAERLAQVEHIRREYHQWKYHAEPGFQRVYTILKQE